MKLYQIHTDTLNPIPEQPFALEKDLQKTFEANLLELTGLRLVKSEFKLKQYRFDTLAFDDEKKAFVIIEYKRDKNHSVVDQGVSYLNALLDYKDSVLMEFNEHFQESFLKRGDVDWSQTRILFVANAFTPFQKQATNFQNLGIELAEFKRYTNGLFSLQTIARESHAPSLPKTDIDTNLSAIQNNDQIASSLSQIAKEIKSYDEEYHLENGSDAIIQLYEQLRDDVLNLDDNLNITYTKIYIAFKKDKTNCVDIAILKNSLKIWLNARWGALNDSLNLFRDVSQIGHHGNGDYEIIIQNNENLEYILSVIKQSIQYNTKQ